MGLASELIQKQAKLQSDRSNFENHWAEIAPLVLPRQDDFFNNSHAEGDRRTRKKYDDTATLALDRGAAAIEGILIPRGQFWHALGLDESLKDDYEAQVWAEDVRKFLFARRYAPNSSFASQAHEYIMSLLAFGTAIMSVEDMVGQGLKYRSSHLSEHFIMENAYGLIDVDYRKYSITAKQAKEKFGDKTPQKVLDTLEKEPNKKMEFLHVVMPDEGNDTDMPFVGYHVSIEDNEIIGIGGFKSFPYIISRWSTAPNETYGRSPAMNVLSEIKMLNQIRKTDLKARHNAVDPPILAADQHTIRKLSMKAGAVNYGAVGPDGRPLVLPYNNGSRIDVSNDAIQQSRAIINDAFYVSLFQILVDTPQMTATEVLHRAEEKGMLLSPNAGRQKGEWLDQMITRELTLYEDYGIFEDDGILPMPDSVKATGGAINIRYTNPLSTMQKSGEAAGTERTVQSLIPVAQIDPSVLKSVDWNEYAKIIAEANGAPKKLFKSPEVIEQEQQQEQQAAMMQQAVDAAPQLAGAVKDIAQAQAIE